MTGICRGYAEFQLCRENVQVKPSGYMQATDFLNIDPKQADEIREKYPISEGALSKRIVSSEKMNRLVKSSNSL